MLSVGFYLRLLEHQDANYYAYPLDLCAEVSEKLEVNEGIQAAYQGR